MQYFTDADNPAYVTTLIRIDYDDVGTLDEMHAFSAADGERWSVRSGWQPSPNAAFDVLWTGDLSRIADTEIQVVQAQMRSRAAP